MRRVLTESSIRAAKSGSGRKELRDGGGLALWLYSSGARSWVYTYALKELDGTERKVRWVFAEYPAVSLADARKKHEAFRELVRNGICPKAEHEREATQEAAKRAAEAAETTIVDLCERYIELYAKPTKKTWAVDQRQISADILPAWGKRKARSIERADVQILLDAIVARGAPVAANRMKALLSRIFRWARSRGYIHENPVDGIEAPAKETPKDRVLSEEEIRVFWGGLDETFLSPRIKSVLRLILTTGQRPGEVAGMLYEEIREIDGFVVWSIPGERRKNGQAHTVPLSTLALEIIGEWKGRKGFVFADANGKPPTVLALGHTLRKTLVAKVEEAAPKKHGKVRRRHIECEPFTPHDLRRSAITLMSAAGVGPLIKPMIAGHTPAGITQKVYDLFSYLPEKSSALEAWGRRLKGIVTGEEPGKVIQLRNRG